MLIWYYKYGHIIGVACGFPSPHLGSLVTDIYSEWVQASLPALHTAVHCYLLGVRETPPPLLFGLHVSGRPHCYYEGPLVLFMSTVTRYFAVDLFFLIYDLVLKTSFREMDERLTSESLATLRNDDLLFQHLLGHSYASNTECLN